MVRLVGVGTAASNDNNAAAVEFPDGEKKDNSAEGLYKKIADGEVAILDLDQSQLKALDTYFENGAPSYGSHASVIHSLLTGDES
jgi:hypothetical protein